MTSPTTTTSHRHLARAALALAAGAIVGTISAHAAATLRREGPWPDAEKTVSLDVSGAPRAEAVRKLAEAAGWSIVVQAPPGDPVDLHVKGQPAVKVLEILLGDGDYVAHREGSLVSIQRLAIGADTSMPPMPPMPAVPPMPAMPAMPAMPPMPPSPPAIVLPTAPPTPPTPPAAESRRKHGNHGEDRVITGGNLRIEKDEVVNDVTVFGGNLDVYGTVTGDVAVMGGSARLHPGSHIMGDATTVGGALKVEEGSEIDGDVGVVGGLLERHDKKHVGVAVVDGDGNQGRPSGHIKLSVADDNDDDDMPRGHINGSRSHFSRIASDVSGAITRNALLFVFGCVLLALLTGRMEKLQVESAARPMRSFAVGLVGAVAATVLLVAMCISIIGIPFAIAAVLLATFATYAGVCAVLTTAGGAVAGHKTKNPYIHLAVGCAMFLVVGAIPFLGGLVTAGVVLVGIGAIIATNGAGMVNGSKPQGSPAYRPG